MLPSVWRGILHLAQEIRCSSEALFSKNSASQLSLFWEKGMALFSQNFWKALLEHLTSHRCNHLLHIWFKIMLKNSIKFIVWVLVPFWWRMYIKVCYTFSFCFQPTGISCPFGATVAHELGVFHFINLNYQCDKIILFFSVIPSFVMHVPCYFIRNKRELCKQLNCKISLETKFGFQWLYQQRGLYSN